MWKRKTECDTSRDRPPRGALNLENKGKASKKYLNKSFCWIVGCCRHALLRSLSYFSKERATRTRPSSTFSSLSCFCCSYIFGIRIYVGNCPVCGFCSFRDGIAHYVSNRGKFSVSADTCLTHSWWVDILPRPPHTKLSRPSYCVQSVTGIF